METDRGTGLDVLHSAFRLARRVAFGLVDNESATTRNRVGLANLNGTQPRGSPTTTPPRAGRS